MFKLFKKKSDIQILNKRYKKLMEQYYHVSKIDRKESDRIFTEAEKVLAQMNLLLDAKSSNA